MLKLTKTIRRRLILIIVGTIVISLAWFCYRQLTRPTALEQPAQPALSPISQPPTAGGQAIPPSWQAKAKTLGYYCPSWNAQPGTASSSLCLPLDK